MQTYLRPGSVRAPGMQGVISTFLLSKEIPPEAEEWEAGSLPDACLLLFVQA